VVVVAVGIVFPDVVGVAIGVPDVSVVESLVAPIPAADCTHPISTHRLSGLLLNLRMMERWVSCSIVTAIFVVVMVVFFFEIFRSLNNCGDKFDVSCCCRNR